jgi:lysyl-tRNA synthetase class II
MLKSPLALLPLDRDVQEICDWFELYVLASEFYSAGFSELARIWDKRKNTQAHNGIYPQPKPTRN